MKKIILIIILISGAKNLCAQNFAEWFEQNKTQIEYLVNQIAAYKVYLDDLEKGYQVAEKGLTAIHDIKKGEFDLHSIFFSSLGSVKPRIKAYSKLADIMLYETAIIIEFKQLQKFGDSYLARVYSNMAGECAKSLDILIAIVTDAKFEMTDDGRIKRIDGIWRDMKDKYAFTRSFTTKANLLYAQKQFENNETDFGYRIFGLQH